MILGGINERVGLPDEDPCVFDPPAPFITFRVVDPDSGRPVGYGERGQVVMHHLSKNMLLPNNLERDLATRIPPPSGQVGDSVADVSPVVRFDDAARYPFVMRAATSGTRLLIEQRLGRRFESLAIAIELEGNAEVVECVEAGLGLALLSETALTRALALGMVVAREIEDADFAREFYLAVPEGRELSEPAAQFVDWLSTRFADARRQDLASA